MPNCKDVGTPAEPIYKGDYSFNTGITKPMSYLDYTILILSIAATTAIGLSIAWKHRRRKSMDDFLLVGRSLSVWPAGLSLAAGVLSGITYVGFPGLVYAAGTMELWHLLVFPVAATTCGAVFVPIYHNLQITSAYEYLEKRFSRPVRILGAIYFIILSVLYLSIVLYAPSTAVSAVTGLNLWGSVLSVGIICMVYTALGGMRAVVYTDAFSMIVMLFGLIVTIIRAYSLVGNFSEILEAADRRNRLEALDLAKVFKFDLSSDATIWSIVFGSYAYILLSFCANQLQIHRCLCCRSEKDAQMALWICVALIWLTIILTAVVGLFISRFYEFCDPQAFGLINESDELYPLFVMDVLNDMYGLSGIFMAGLFSATLSTVSSGLNSIAAVTLEDCFRVYFWAHIGEGRARLMIQVITIFFGMICLELAYFADRIKGGLYQIDQALTAAIGSPLIGVFILGMLFPWANKKGALFGMLGATATNFALFYMKKGINIDEESSQQRCIANCNETIFKQELIEKFLTLKDPTTNIYETETNFLLQLSSRFYGSIGILVTLIIGMTVSAITGFTDVSTIEPALISPLFDIHFPFYYLPESIRYKLRFGIDHTDKWKRYHIKREQEEAARKAAKEKEAALKGKTPNLFAPQAEYGQSPAPYPKKPGSVISGVSGESEL